jgi:hypothetical protein
MKRLLTATAIVFTIILTAGISSAFTPFEINTTSNDGFLYFYPQDVTTSTDVTLYYSETPNLASGSFQLTLVQATPLSTPPVPDTVNGLDLYSGTITLPVGAISTTPAPVTFDISAIQFEDVYVDGNLARHWTFKGTSGTGALVSGEIWGFLSKMPDRTGGTKPYPLKYTYEINGYVTSNGSNFNGSMHGKLYQ